MNTNIRDTGNFFLARPMAEMRQSVAQSISNGVAAGTPIAFDAEDLDRDNAHSTSSNTSRYTAQTPGWYQMSGGVAFAANATGRRIAWLLVNGSTVNASEGYGVGSAGGETVPMIRTRLVYLNGTGDYVEMAGYQDSGGALLTLASGFAASGMSVRWVSS